MKKLLSAALLLSLLVSACTSGPTYRRLEGSTWNTLYHIVYRSSVDLDDSVRAVMRQVEMSLSPFADSSLISHINRGEPVPADTMITLIFNTSREVNRLSGGMFDPTVAPLVNLWGFGYRDDSAGTEPTQALIDSMLLRVGIDGCHLDSATRLIEKKSALTEFNFSAITKGFGCDMVAAMMKRNNVTDYMIEIGGEIAMSGVNDRSIPWRIQVDKPIVSDSIIIHEPMLIIAPGDKGVATSGNYRNFRRDASGKFTFGHTISPVTGRPVMSQIAGATVIAPTCMLADALATACMAMHPDSALAMTGRIPGVEAMIVISTDGSTFTPRFTPGFNRYVVNR